MTRHIQIYSKPPCNPGVFRTRYYSEPWYIQSPAYSEPEAHSESFQRSMMERFAKIVNGYNYLCKL